VPEKLHQRLFLTRDHHTNIGEGILDYAYFERQLSAEHFRAARNRHLYPRDMEI
jgi:hypothetical protein